MSHIIISFMTLDSFDKQVRNDLILHFVVKKNEVI